MTDDTNLFETIEERPSPRPDDEAPQPGSSLGRHVLLETLGSGGMGVVFAAYDPHLDRKIALKVLHRRFARSGSGGAGGRLLREARAMARLSHPNVIAVHDVGTVDGRVFVAMEFIDGATMLEWEAERDRPWDEIVDAYLGAATGLAHAHRAGLIHRDFKPDNVMIDGEGRVRVLDFGLARTNVDVTNSGGGATGSHADGPLDGPTAIPGGATTFAGEPGSEALSRTGGHAGTPAYMSPEQHLGSDLDARSDQFSFCVALWEALYGERPFPGDSLATIAFNVTQGNRRDPPRDAKVPAHVRDAMARGLEVEPDRRWPSMDALIESLTPPKRGRLGLLVGTGAIGAAAIALAIFARVPAPSLCQRNDADARLGEVWNDDARRRIRAGFTTSELPRADRDAARTVDRIDAWTEGWTDAWVEACESANVRGEWSAHLLDRANACLTRRLRSVHAMTALFDEPSAEWIERAAKTAEDLPSVAGCTDSDRLLAEVALPADAATAGRVAAARGRVAEIEVLDPAGLYEEGLRRAELLLAESADVDYEPLMAELQMTVGIFQAHAHADKAAEMLREAYFSARSVGHSRVAGRSALELMVLYADRLSRFEEATLWGRLAEIEIEHAHDPDLRAKLWSHLGTVHMDRGDLDLAEEMYRRALAYWESTPDADANAFGMRVNLSTILTNRGEYDRARAGLDDAIEGLSRLYDPGHPDVISAMVNVSRLEYARGRHEEAVLFGRRAIALADENLGPANQLSDAALRNVANVRYEQGQWNEALETYDDLLRRAMELHGPDTLDVAGLQSNRGNTLIEMGRSEEALAAFRRAIEIIEGAGGADHPELGFPRQGLGSAMVRLGDHVGAIPVLLGAVRAWEGLGEHHPLVAWPLTSLGEAYLALGQPSEAVTVLRRAVRLRSGDDPDDRNLADSRRLLARALIATGAEAEGRAAATSALAAYQTHDDAGEEQAEAAALAG